MKNTHSFNFLLELIIVILFFTFSSIVFVGLFAKAYQMNEEASVKAEASYALQNIAEEFKMTGRLDSFDKKDMNESYQISVSIEDEDCTIEAIYEGKVIEEIHVKYLEVNHE